MRLLFVSSTTVGGSGRSQRELATQLERRGHQIEFLVDDDTATGITRFAYGHLSDLAVRTSSSPGRRLTSWLERRPGRRTHQATIDGRAHTCSAIPQNALPDALDAFAPDVVVGNSLERLTWRRIHQLCEQRNIPTVLYVRETDSLGHLATGAHPDLLVANAQSLCAAFADLEIACEFIPSVIDTSTTMTESKRATALSINPIESRGVDVIWRIAAEAPEIPIEVRESWPLDDRTVTDVQSHAARLTNVTFRRAVVPGPALYGEARVLLVPYRVDNRPRVITEAQSNGIPVLAADVPALREAVGEGGAVVGIDDIEEWVFQLRLLWNDADHYRRLSEAALAHSKRPDTDPAVVAGGFEALVAGVLQRRRDAGRPPSRAAT